MNTNNNKKLTLSLQDSHLTSLTKQTNSLQAKNNHIQNFQVTKIHGQIGINNQNSLQVQLLKTPKDTNPHCNQTQKPMAL